MKNITYVLVSFLAGIVILAMSTFTVDQREYAIVFRLGESYPSKKSQDFISKHRLLKMCGFLIIEF